MENVDKIKRGEPVQDPDKIIKATIGGGCAEWSFRDAAIARQDAGTRLSGQPDSSSRSSVMDSGFACFRLCAPE